MSKTNEMIYFIMDTDKRFGGKISICSNSMTSKTDWKWDYFSQSYPKSGHMSKYNAELNIQRLRELNTLAEYDLDWEVVELTSEQWMDIIRDNHQKMLDLGRNPMLDWHYNSSIEWKEIEKGKKCSHRKAVKDIYKKYKGMTKRWVA